jgi:hypothetical protein
VRCCTLSPSHAPSNRTAEDKPRCVPVLDQKHVKLQCVGTWGALARSSPLINKSQKMNKYWLLQRCVDCKGRVALCVNKRCFCKLFDDLAHPSSVFVQVVMARLLQCCEQKCCTSVCAIAVCLPLCMHQLTSGPGMLKPPQAVLLHAMKGRTKLNLHPYKNARRPAIASISNATE